MRMVKFDGLELPAAQLAESHRFENIRARKGWTRVQFVLEDRFDGAQRVNDWLAAHCAQRFSSYHYHNPDARHYSYIMVVNFESRNDALLFKLSDGFRSGETQ